MGPEPLAPEAETYLRRLGSCLASSFDPEEREEIVAELRAHFAERRSQGRPNLLDGFEPPEAYAARFIEESALSKAVARGTTLALGRALLSSAETVFLVFPLLVVQFGAVALLVLGLFKPFLFRHIGFFRDAGSWDFGFSSDPSARPDVFGWWTVPLFIAPSVIVFWGCNRAMRALARRRLASARRADGKARSGSPTQ